LLIWIRISVIDISHLWYVLNSYQFIHRKINTLTFGTNLTFVHGSDDEEVRGRVVKLWYASHLLTIILCCVYWHATVICVLCIDCVVVLTFVSSLRIHLAVCRWLYSLHLLCWYFTLLHSLVFLVALTGYMCFISFIVSYSLVGYPVVVISTAINK
jgi:hypothetical protein